MEITTVYLGRYHSEQLSFYHVPDRSPLSLIVLSYHESNCVGPIPKNIALHIFGVQLPLMIFVIGEITFILLVAFDLRSGERSGLGYIQWKVAHNWTGLITW